MELESFLFAVRAAGTSDHTAGRDHFESSGRISACKMTGAQKPQNFFEGNHDESSALST